MIPPPGQINPALHFTHGPTLVESLTYPGLQVHASWFVEPDEEKLNRGHWFETPPEHQNPGKHDAHDGPAYPSLQRQAHEEADAYDAWLGAPVQLVQNRSATEVHGAAS